MRILIITTRFFPHVGGVEEVVSNIAKILSKDNVVSILSSLDINTGLSFFKRLTKISVEERTFETYKNKRIWINLPSSIVGILIFPARFILALIEVIFYVSKFKPDVINYHFPDDSVVYVDLLSSVIRVPIVVNIHGNDLHIFSKKAIHKFFINRLLKRASLIVVNSAYMKAEFLDSFPHLSNKLRIIPNGLDVDLYKQSKVGKKYAANGPYIFYVGRLVEKKGVDILIRAFYKLRDEKINLVIEGKGEELSKIKELVRGLDLTDKVKFTDGKLTQEEKIEAMKGAIFGVIPSRVEPFGIVALEFLAAGTPIIASKTGGLENLLKDQSTCLFFENGNIGDLASKMKGIMEKENLRKTLKEEGQKEVENYRWEVITQKYLNTYKEAE